LSLQIKVENVGVAPFYFDWPVVVFLVDGEGGDTAQAQLPVDIRQWLPGSHSFSASITIPDDIKLGTFKIYLTIQDPASGATGIQFANKNRDALGRSLLATVQVE
jgi:hypothetical protein